LDGFQQAFDIDFWAFDIDFRVLLAAINPAVLLGFAARRNPSPPISLHEFTHDPLFSSPAKIFRA
jgi:hypothetical protein